MAGQIMRYKGEQLAPGWFDMAQPDTPIDVPTSTEPRDMVATALANATAPAPSPAFGAIAGRGPAPNRSGQQLGKGKQAAAVSKSFKGKLGKTWDIAKDALGVNAFDRLMHASPYDLYGNNDPAVGEQLAGDAFQVATAAQAGSMPFERPANSVSMFIGRKAKTYPHDMEAKALDMIRDGHTVESARRATGIDFDSAGNPRFEISDHNMKFTPEGEQYFNSNAMEGIDPVDQAALLPPMGRIIDHPELYSAYPEAANAPFKVTKKDWGSGMFIPPYKGGGVGIVANGPSADMPTRGINGTVEDVATHEIQHLIQNLEGNKPRGSNPRDIPHAAIKHMDNMTRTEAELRGLPIPEIGSPEIHRNAPSHDTLYRREGGEQEANATKWRRTLTPEERRSATPQHRLSRHPVHEGITPREGESTNRALQWNNMPDGSVQYPALNGPHPDLLNADAGPVIAGGPDAPSGPMMDEPLRVYRGSPIEGDTARPVDFAGTYVSADPKAAAQYGNVKAYQLPAHTKILDMNTINDPSSTASGLVRAYLIGKGEPIPADAGTFQMMASELHSGLAGELDIDTADWPDFVKSLGYHATKEGPDIHVLDPSMLEPVIAGGQISGLTKKGKPHAH